MLINKDLKLKYVCEDKKGLRETLKNPYFRNGKILATDGHKAAIIEAQECEQDIEGSIPLEALNAASKLPLSIILLKDEYAKTSDEKEFARSDLPFPNLEQVIIWPKKEKSIRIGFDIQMLYDLIRATSKKVERIEIEIPFSYFKQDIREKLLPFKVKNLQADQNISCFLMPCRLNETDVEANKKVLGIETEKPTEKPVEDLEPFR